MKIRIILSIAVGLFSLMSGMAGQWTFNPQTGRLRHDESGWILMAETNGARNLTIVKTITAPTGILPLNDPIDGGYAVTMLGRWAFFKCRALRTFICPDTLSSTDENAFSGCANLTTLILSKSTDRDFFTALSGGSTLYTISVPTENPYLKSIDDVVFSADASVLIRCPTTRSESYLIPDGVQEIQSDAFANCSRLTSITLPASIRKIGEGAFMRCTRLNSLDLPSGITSIGDAAFFGCTGLEEITLPASVTEISSSLFSGCTKLRAISLPPRLDYIGMFAFSGCSALEECDIPDGPETIDGGTFNDCTALRRIRLPGTLTELIQGAFQNCRSLKNLHLPKSLPQSGFNTFFHFSDLESFSVDADHPDFKTIDGVLFSKDGRELFSFPRGRSGVYTVPSGVTTISGVAFSGSKKLTSVIVPFGVERIRGAVFHECSSLLSIDLPDSVYEIGPNAFMDCTALHSVHLPGKLEKLSTSLFAGCRNLKSIVIPDSVQVMDGGVFAVCERLEAITLPAGLSKMRTSEFSGCLRLTNITVSAENRYYRDIDGVLFDHSGETLIQFPIGRKGKYTIPNGTRILASDAFYRNQGLESVTIPESVVDISSAFSTMGSLRSIEIPDSVTNIGAYAFSYCKKLESVKLPATHPSIPDGLFSSCPNLTTVVFPNDVTDIGKFAFSGCKKLELTNLPATSIPSTHDLHGSGTLPNSIRQIGNYAFHYAHVPAALYLPEELKIIEKDAFYLCQDLEHVIIQSNLSRLDDEAFAECPKLKSVIFNGAYPTKVGEDILQGSNSATTFVTRAFAASWDTDVSFGPIGAEHAIWQGRPIVYVGATAQSNAPVPEAWQAANFKKAAAAVPTPPGTHDDDDDYDPDGDPDGDGMTNAQEYVAGTNPNDADSVFRALITVEAGQVKIHWEPDLGEARVYTIEGKVNLTDTEWVSPATEHCRFFRVRVSLPPE